MKSDAPSPAIEAPPHQATSPAPAAPPRDDPPSAAPVLKSRRRAGVETTIVPVGNVRFGDGSYPVVAGPIAVESEDQIGAAGRIVAETGGSMLRSAAFRAESSPYRFRGLGEDALWMLEKAGNEAELPTVTEVLEPSHLELVARHVDMVEIGPDHMQDFALLRAAGQLGLPVMLHRGSSSTIDEWLMAAEYVLAEGNDDIVLVERGSRGFDPRLADTPDISVVPVVQRLTHLPVLVAPSLLGGGTDVVEPLALAGRSAGADGVVVAMHPDPSAALAGNGSQLDGPGFAALMEVLGIPTLRDEIDRIDRELVKLVARRLHSSVEIARIKADRGLPLRSPDREAELIAETERDAAALGVEPGYVAELMTLILAHSRRAQRRALGASDDDAPGG